MTIRTHLANPGVDGVELRSRLIGQGGDRIAIQPPLWNALHELGRLLLYREACPGSRELEDQADRFASAFLLPRVPFLAECPTRLSWPQLIEMKRRWKVSLQALVRRGYDLGVYSEATYRRAYMQINQRGWQTVEPAEPPMERPALLAEAMRAGVAMGYSLEELRRQVSSLGPFDFRQLVQTAAV